MKHQLAGLLLVGFSGVVLAQGAQQGGASQERAQPRQQQSSPERAQQGAQRETQSQVPTFDAADKNKDGRLSRAEAGDVDGLDFSKADINQNASLDRQEYMAATASDPQSQPRRQER
jgi:hypothetical protein